MTFNSYPINLLLAHYEIIPKDFFLCIATDWTALQEQSFRAPLCQLQEGRETCNSITSNNLVAIFS